MTVVQFCGTKLFAEMNWPVLASSTYKKPFFGAVITTRRDTPLIGRSAMLTWNGPS
jgi:hypothetical protein